MELLNVETETIFRSSRPSYGDDAISYVQLKREGKICTVKCKICPEHKVHAKLYGVTLTVDEDEKVTSVQCHDCVAVQGGYKHAIALLTWIHRRSEEPSCRQVYDLLEDEEQNHTVEDHGQKEDNESSKPISNQKKTANRKAKKLTNYDKYVREDIDQTMKK
ncbi:hypothetical protein FQA39_LY16634 [Lamprigera yunnana]|nr:hypothetical protein FQA39_LY16634 [Lamprigera yunnana]